MSGQQPYIVTVRRDPPPFVLPPTHAVDRQAVATLQGARDVARDVCFEKDYDAGTMDIGAILDAETLPAEGGSVSLPDGTEIRVEAFTEADFRVKVCGVVPNAIDVRMPLADVIAAANAAWGSDGEDAQRLEHGWLTKDGYLCDGCSVREPFEHRCHGDDGGRRCTCKECNSERFGSETQGAADA